MAAGHYAATSFRTLGTAATPHNLLTIENTHATTLVKIKRITVQLDATAVLIAVMPAVKSGRATGVPTGGTTLAKTPFDTTATSDGAIIVRGATASDGGAATAITSTMGNIIWQQYCMRMHTVVGQVLAEDSPLIPTLCETTPIILRQNEALLVSVVAAIGTSNPATNHWAVQVAWEEV